MPVVFLTATASGNGLHKIDAQRLGYAHGNGAHRTLSSGRSLLPQDIPTPDGESESLPALSEANYSVGLFPNNL